jgi:hypothetical protein
MTVRKSGWAWGFPRMIFRHTSFHCVQLIREFFNSLLEPLDRNQVERFVGANGVAGVQAFAQALDRAFAWEFARRPLDVADLIGFWNANGRIGSLTELIEFDVSSKLRPREGRDEFSLSEAEGREGTEWLAAVSVFSRRFSFGVPDDGSTNADSLNPRDCLPSHWRDDQTRALLNRAIFDSAVYGHFRFHHRRVGEYLRELADDPAMANVRDWTLNILDKRLVNEADSDPWTPADIREFAEHHEVDPKNDRELFAIARKRLQVLKWNVEQSDNSARTELHKEYHEIELRRWLQRRLIERSQKRYTIPQEAEIDQQERPDLRLENPKTGPVSIEVKWADNWTLPQLLERLENQLVGQYLRAHNSRYGIYFLGFIGKKQYWEEPTTGKGLTFEEVVNIVRQRAIFLMQSNPKILGLEVVSIDFRQPENI